MFKLLKKIAGRKKNKVRIGKNTLASQKNEKSQSLHSLLTENVKLLNKFIKYQKTWM